MTPDDEMMAILTDLFRLPGHEWPARALLQVDRATGSVIVVQPEPCDCQPAGGATSFPAGADGCKDATTADGYRFRYEQLEQHEVDALSPADLNNLACYLLWQTDATPESAKAAHDLLKRARDRCAGDDPLRGTIEGNLDRFRPVSPGLPLAMLRDAVYGSGRVMASLEGWAIIKEE